MNEPLKLAVEKQWTNQVPAFDLVFAELSPFMSELEIDIIIRFMNQATIVGSHNGLTVSDAVWQIKQLIGDERYHNLKMEWTLKNQKAVTIYGNRKYREKATGKIWDGLDDTDDPNNYEQIFV